MDKVYETEHTVQMHTHPCYELTYYADGTGATEVEGEKSVLFRVRLLLPPPTRRTPKHIKTALPWYALVSILPRLFLHAFSWIKIAAWLIRSALSAES